MKLTCIVGAPGCWGVVKPWGSLPAHRCGAGQGGQPAQVEAAEAAVAHEASS